MWPLRVALQRSGKRPPSGQSFVVRAADSWMCMRSNDFLLQLYPDMAGAYQIAHQARRSLIHASRSLRTAMHPEADATLPDYLPDRPDILFVGINPASYSVRRGHYYARTTNRFWWALHASGLVPVPLSPQEDWRVIEFG